MYAIVITNRQITYEEQVDFTNRFYKWSVIDAPRITRQLLRELPDDLVIIDLTNTLNSFLHLVVNPL